MLSTDKKCSKSHHTFVRNFSWHLIIWFGLANLVIISSSQTTICVLKDPRKISRMAVQILDSSELKNQYHLALQVMKSAISRKPLVSKIRMLTLEYSSYVSSLWVPTSWYVTFLYPMVCESTSHCPCGGGVEYLHRDPASRRRRRKGKSRV
jgi:hypothetical protein